ncbi:MULTISPECIES: hypothetical protein [Caulobacter]|jgi:hypothetical protein|uniref:Uncharacterized protein n=1 Tax=Caulobacter rhizosphaerae TaxID=2010972 RepID=A0ABU1MZJ2_9CAUL|nr:MULTISPECIES: hypothetical protein [Caulobacter]KQZ18300.1 hypothetical protein ASD47_10230 [Caulobacter sp. Root1472]MDR6531597.1 hypothetical protein [Caulobacter rhizosphaerae]GGL38500.1 hypothetical protein GCM10010983_39480 [Caulobacter rhizosphaerae]
MATAFLLALALIAQDAPVSTAPTASAPPPRTQPAATAPTDDYGYVGWCYGALGGYVELYDKVMPEVTRIEKTFPGPDGFNAAMKEYPAMRAQAKKDLATYRSAIVAAEKASPRPISEYGAAAIKKGHSVWTGADQIDKARLAQVWMSWSPPSDCDTRAKTLETKSNLFGQALNYNVKKDAAPPVEETKAPEPAPTAAETAAPASEPEAPPPSVAEAAPAETPAAPAPVATPAVAKPTTKPAAKKTATALPPIGAKPAAMPIAAKGEIIIDPNDPKPCAGSLVPAKRGGKNVLICKAD